MDVEGMYKWRKAYISMRKFLESMEDMDDQVRGLPDIDKFEELFDSWDNTVLCFDDMMEDFIDRVLREIDDLKKNSRK